MVVIPLSCTMPTERPPRLSAPSPTAQPPPPILSRIRNLGIDTVKLHLLIVYYVPIIYPHHCVIVPISRSKKRGNRNPHQFRWRKISWLLKANSLSCHSRTVKILVVVFVVSGIQLIVARARWLRYWNTALPRLETVFPRSSWFRRSLLKAIATER